MPSPRTLRDAQDGQDQQRVPCLTLPQSQHHVALPPVLHRCPGARAPPRPSRRRPELRSPSVRAEAVPCTRLDRTMASTSLDIPFFPNTRPRKPEALYVEAAR